MSTSEVRERSHSALSPARRGCIRGARLRPTSLRPCLPAPLLLLLLCARPTIASATHVRSTTARSRLRSRPHARPPASAPRAQRRIVCRAVLSRRRRAHAAVRTPPRARLAARRYVQRLRACDGARRQAGDDALRPSREPAHAAPSGAVRLRARSRPPAALPHRHAVRLIGRALLPTVYIQRSHFFLSQLLFTHSYDLTLLAGTRPSPCAALSPAR